MFKFVWAAAEENIRVHLCPSVVKMGTLRKPTEAYGREGGGVSTIQPFNASTFPLPLMLSLKSLAINNVEDGRRFVKDSVKP